MGRRQEGGRHASHAARRGALRRCRFAPPAQTEEERLARDARAAARGSVGTLCSTRPSHPHSPQRWPAASRRPCPTSFCAASRSSVCWIKVRQRVQRMSIPAEQHLQIHVLAQRRCSASSRASRSCCCSRRHISVKPCTQCRRLLILSQRLIRIDQPAAADIRLAVVARRQRCVQLAAWLAA